MAVRAFIALVMLFAWICGANAQRAADRIDLERFADEPTGLVSMGVAFAESAATCPQDQALLKIGNGALAQLRSANRPMTGSGQYKTLNDETHLLESSTSECRIDMRVRMQVLRDGSWTSLRVPTRRAEDVMAQARERVEQLSPQERQERLDRFNERQRTGWSFGRVGTMRLPFSFDQAPPDCFQAIGEYVLHRNGITFSFPINLPGELNRFAIERFDIDNMNARFYFARDACRFEITISKSVLHDGERIALPLAPAPTPRTQGP
jgi:hypothetical protein